MQHELYRFGFLLSISNFHPYPSTTLSLSRIMFWLPVFKLTTGYECMMPHLNRSPYLLYTNLLRPVTLSACGVFSPDHPLMALGWAWPPTRQRNCGNCEEIYSSNLNTWAQTHTHVTRSMTHRTHTLTRALNNYSHIQHAHPYTKFFETHKPFKMLRLCSTRSCWETCEFNMQRRDYTCKFSRREWQNGRKSFRSLF